MRGLEQERMGPAVGGGRGGLLARLDRVDARLSGRRARWGALGGVVLLAAVLRAVYWAQVSGTLGFGRPMVDAMDYERMARGVLDGSWPGDSVFFVDPLYAYLLAGWRAVFGEGTEGVLVGQMVVGAIGAGVFYGVAASFLRASEALFAGVLAASYGVYFFFEGIELKTSLAVFGVVVFLLALVRARGKGLGRSFVAGVVLGVGTLLRGNLLALGPVAAVWLLGCGGTDRVGSRTRWGRPVALLFGILLALAPATVHNVAAGDFVLTTSNLGANLYTGNGAHNDSGSYVPVLGVRASPVFEEADFRGQAEDALGRKLAPSEVSRYWVRRTLEEARAEPGRVAWLLGKKALLFWNAVEVPDNESFAKTREEVAILRAPLPSFALLLVLAAAACVLIRWKPEHVLALGVVATVGLTVVVFFVNARFRLTAVPGLMLLAASLPGGVARAVARRALGRGMLAVVVAGAAWGVTRLEVYDVSRTMLDYNDAVLALEAGDRDGALAHLEQALAEEPNNWRAELLRGEVLDGAGRGGEARAAFGHATDLAPEQGEVWLAYGGWLARAGELGEAEVALKKVLGLASSEDSERETAALQLADVERRGRKFDSARERLAVLLRKRPHRAQAWFVLGKVELDAGENAAAEEALRGALREKPENVRFRMELARCLRRSGRPEEARSEYQAVLARDPSNDEARRGLAAVGG